MNQVTAINVINEYIRQFPEGVLEILSQLRQTISGATPEAKEKISYQMPTFYLYGNLVHFAAYKNHIVFNLRLFPPFTKMTLYLSRVQFDESGGEYVRLI